MCHEARRNSPSVADCSPTSSCLRTTSRIASSSIPRSSSASIRPSLKSSRACSSSGGRRRLPTWSARKGGVVRGDMARNLPCVRAAHGCAGMARPPRLSCTLVSRPRARRSRSSGPDSIRSCMPRRSAKRHSTSRPTGSTTPRSHGGFGIPRARCATGAARAMCRRPTVAWYLPALLAGDAAPRVQRCRLRRAARPLPRRRAHQHRGANPDAAALSLDAKYPTVNNETEALLRRCFPENRVGRVLLDRGSTVVLHVYSRHLACLFPQAGPGKKHARPIVLEAWQAAHVAAAPWAFLRGCIRSDGCAFVNRTGPVRVPVVRLLQPLRADPPALRRRLS